MGIFISTKGGSHVQPSPGCLSGTGLFWPSHFSSYQQSTITNAYCTRYAWVHTIRAHGHIPALRHRDIIKLPDREEEICRTHRSRVPEPIKTGCFIKHASCRGMAAFRLLKYPTMYAPHYAAPAQRARLGNYAPRDFHHLYGHGGPHFNSLALTWQKLVQACGSLLTMAHPPPHVPQSKPSHSIVYTSDRNTAALHYLVSRVSCRLSAWCEVRVLRWPVCFTRAPFPIQFE